MHTVERLQRLVKTAKQAGIHVRFEWLDGTGGGVCEIRGQQWLFVDLAADPSEQLEQSLGGVAKLLGENQLLALLNGPVVPICGSDQELA